jgi:SAM-dependent MidA family methyltransferase
MGSSPESSTSVSPEFAAVFRRHANADGTMTFAQFMALALYDPSVGYYRRDRTRVGYGAGTDFFTSSSSGPVFGALVANACGTLLRAAGRDPGTHTFVEVGAEPTSAGVLSGVEHPFAGSRILRLGEPATLTGDCVVFSNELFDAQPFVRTVYRGGRWHELGVRLENERLVQVELDHAFDAAPTNVATDGYHFDRSTAATELAGRLAAEPWRGLFVAFDYGKTLRELTTAFPQGTARAYYRHGQSNDLLARPGEQDLTCHVCWDWITDALRHHGFGQPALEFQESFFLRHASNYIREASAADAARFTTRKVALLQLLHPTHMGQKFQVLHALR